MRRDCVAFFSTLLNVDAISVNTDACNGSACRALNDRQAGSLATRAIEDHYEHMGCNWYGEGTGEGLKRRAMFDEQIATAERGSASRNLQVGDCFTYTWKCQPYDATGVLRIMLNGKTNQVRK
jgi:hypothetical protein